jgi:hypothetical protein
MKNIILFSSAIFFGNLASAQNFDKDMASAKSSFASNKLADAHFALQQALSEVDLVTGKKILRILPGQIGKMNTNPKDDNVFTNAGFVGATVHRTWGQPQQEASLDIISNSPLISGLSAMMNTPLIGGMMNSDKSKTIKVAGYKARLENNGPGTGGGSNYTLQIPITSALITFTVKNTTESEVLNYANTLPLGEIAKMVQ